MTNEYVVEYSEYTTSDGIKYRLPFEMHEEIVRCKDCQNATPDGRFCYEFGEYDDPANVDPNGFCAWATKRGEI